MLPVALAFGGQQLARSKTKEPSEVKSQCQSQLEDDGNLPIVECFLLMSLSSDGGVPSALPCMAHDIGFAGAILIDLMLDRRILFQHGRVKLVDRALTGHTLLDQALQKLRLASSDLLTLGQSLELLAEDASNLKHAGFEHLTDRGLVTIKRRVLVSGFEAHFFPHTNDGNRRSLMSRLVRSEDLELQDVLAVCAANACGLFDEILSKKRAKRLANQVHQLVEANVVGEEVIETIESISRAGNCHNQRSASTAAGKRAQENKKNNNWEWRAFWSDRRPVVTPCDTTGLDASVKFKTTNVSDRYLLIPERRDNIKMRKHGLEVKELIESHRHYEAFRPKEVLKFPIKAGDLARVFPRLYGRSGKVSDEAELEETLRTHGYAPSHVDVEKLRNRVRLADDVRLEFCQFTVEHRTCWSACVEGPDFSRVRACVHTINPQEGRVMGYMDFLHRIVDGQ